MRIIYIANVRFPTERAHGIQIMNTCVALSALGHDVELVVPYRRNAIKEDPFNFYNLSARFPVIRLPSLDLIGIPGIRRGAFILQSFSFLISVFVRYRKIFKEKDVVVYGRDEIILAPLSRVVPCVFWESHMGQNNFFARILIEKARGIVCITKSLADFYANKGVSQDRLHISPDAVDVSRFTNISARVSDLRKKLQLPHDVRIVTYSGSLGLYSWKGVDVFLDSLALIPDKDIRFMLVGGSREEVLDLRKIYSDPRIIFVGHVKPHMVPHYLKASDVLVIPNKAGNIISESYTSPMKLFEYMAAQKPVIASDLSSIREIVDSSSAVLFPADEPSKLAEAVQTLLNDSVLSDQLTAKAFVVVQDYTWDKRAQGIIDFLRYHD